MKNQSKNEEILSRRGFFKKAAKSALPIIALGTLGSMLNSCGDPDDGGGSSSGSSSSGCNGGCQNKCGGSCTINCQSVCKGISISYLPATCSGAGCKGECYSSCRGTCNGKCQTGNKN